MQIALPVVGEGLVPSLNLQIASPGVGEGLVPSLNFQIAQPEVGEEQAPPLPVPKGRLFCRIVAKKLKKAEKCVTINKNTYNMETDRMAE